MTDTINTQYGQYLPLQFTFYQEETGGDPVDLSGASVTIRESNRDAFGEATITVTDAENGVVSVVLTESDAEGLGHGRTNWFRLEADFSTSNIVTPKIWINVQ